MWRGVFLTGILAVALSSGLTRAESAPDSDRNLFVMTGRFLDESMGDSLNIHGATYEDNYVTGLGFQWYGPQFRILKLGYEVGAVMRYGEGDTTEIWGGAVARFRDFHLSRHWTVRPSVVFGLSHVNAAHPGRETRQVAKYDGDADLLFYLSPELELVRSEQNWGLFWRLHHRSGGGQTLGHMKGATNANVIGIRKRF
jgi:hypothetical protein